MRTLHLTIVALLAFTLAMSFCAVSCFAQDTPGWKILTSEAGWSIKYPQSWNVWSCVSCPDPTAANVYATFGVPSADGPSVMVEPLGNKPARDSTQQWLNSLKGTANLNPILSEVSISVNGLQGLQVKYVTATNTPMWETYLVSGSKTFHISVMSTDPRVYAIYQQMVQTFTVKGH